MPSTYTQLVNKTNYWYVGQAMYAETDGLKKKLYSKQTKQAKMAIDYIADNKVEILQ